MLMYSCLLSGVTIEPHKKQLHCSLAYQFPTEKKEKLETLAKAINLKAPVRWDLRLYSRDVLKGKGSYQVCFALSAKFTSCAGFCIFVCLQCFDAVGWAAGRASGL